MITMMATKDDDKGDEKNLKGQSKDEFKMFKKESRTRMSSRCSRRNQEQFKIKTQEEKLKNISRFKKTDEFKNQDQDSRFKNQEKT